MARDYKSRAASKGSGKRTPVWIWLLVGYVFGGFSVAMIWWSQAPKIPQQESWIGAKPKSMQPAVRVSEPEVAESNEIEPPHFDFYSLLPELEVVVPEEELDRKPNKPSTDEAVAHEAEAPVPKSGYLIQVSSFRNGRDADRLKAQLALLGLYAQVNQASIKGITWHRVRVGPYNSVQAVQSARQQLSNNGYNPMVIKNRH